MKSSRRPTEFEQNNYDVTSIPGCVIKKNSSRGVKHGLSERRKMYYQARQMLKKARQESTDAIQRYFHDCTPRRIQKVIVRHRVERKKHDATRPNYLVYFRAIQGHSGGVAMDPELQDNVLLPKGFTEYIYHVGNASEVHLIFRSGLIPGGQSLKRGGQSVFFTIVNPMEDDTCMEETPFDLTKPGRMNIL